VRAGTVLHSVTLHVHAVDVSMSLCVCHESDTIPRSFAVTGSAHFHVRPAAGMFHSCPSVRSFVLPLPNL